MSNEAYNWARKQRVGTASAKAVLLDLAERANVKAQCWPKPDTVAADLEISTRLVNNAYSTLKRLGLITTSRRYVGLQRLEGDLVTLHLDASAQVESTPKKPRGRTQNPTTQASGKHPDDSSATPEQNANFAVCSTVDNPSGTQTLRSTAVEQNANFAEQTANFAGHNKEQPSRTPIDDDQSSETVTNRAGPLSYVDERLKQVDPRLNEAGIRDHLMREHGLTLDGVNVNAAALVVWARKTPGSVSNPIAFLAKSIASAPHNPEWADLSGGGHASGQGSEACLNGDHRWTGPWNEICVRCDTLRDGWRDDRDRTEAEQFAHTHEFESEDEHDRCTICDIPRIEIREPIEEGANR